MGRKTDIPYVDATWNPWRGCTPVSPGCAHCYARRLVERWGKSFRAIVRQDKQFYAPLKWKKPRHIFPCSISDFFHPDVPPEWRFEAWKVIKACPHHIFQPLTKRPELIRDMLPPDWGDGYYNVWIGVSVEDQFRADIRIPELIRVPARVRFLSCEPLLGPIDLSEWLVNISWVIVGGESGPGHREMKEEWAIDIMNQCAIESDIPFYFKQHSALRPNTYPVLAGKEWREMPKI